MAEVIFVVVVVMEVVVVVGAVVVGVVEGEYKSLSPDLRNHWSC